MWKTVLSGAFIGESICDAEVQLQLQSHVDKKSANFIGQSNNTFNFILYILKTHKQKYENSTLNIQRKRQVIHQKRY